MVSFEKLRVAVAGLGRMGARHARHFAELTPRAELIAVTSPEQKELDWAKVALPGVRTYLSYDEMLKEEIKNGLQAVVVSSATAVHAEQAIKALKAGLHLLCEKPISTNVEISQSVVDTYRQTIKQFPQQKALCGFSRRFDASYRDVYDKIQSGMIGTPSVFRSQTCDKLDPSGFFVQYAQFSGGIFVDCSIHDIDLALWMFGEDSDVKSVSAVGITAVEPDLRKYNDRDNALAVVEFHNGKIAQFYASRMMAAGQEDTTEVIGTKGKLSVNMSPQQNLVQIFESSGVRREIPQTYYDRFRDAFITEANEFTACCLDNVKLPFELEGAIKAVVIGHALQESLVQGKRIEFDVHGQRVGQVQAKL